MTEEKPKARARGTREETEQAIVASALRLLETNGILAGITIRDVVRESQVNQGQIYQYFGDRRGLLRSAISRSVESDMPDMSEHFKLTFKERRTRMWQWAMDNTRLIELQALLAIEGENDVPMFPAFHEAVDRVAKDQETGSVDPQLDPMMVHLMTTSMFLGYGLFRHVMAARAETTVEDLDERAEALFLKFIDRLTPEASESDDLE